MGGVAGNKNWGPPAAYWQRELGQRRPGSRRIPKWYDGPFDTGQDAQLRTAVEAAAAVAAALDPYLHGKAIEPIARQAELSTKTVGEIVAGKVWPGLESIALIAAALDLELRLEPLPDA